ncbi:MAG: HAD family phosphatase [Acidobacteria bacterium]|nr:HAD family phosphatase [Acidobacteriota bacterium]
MIKAILFDFNGVIINDEPVQMKAYQEVFKAEDIELTEEDYFSCLGMDDRTFINTIYERAGKTPEGNKVLEISVAKTKRWRELIAEELPLFDGITDFVKKMAQDFALGVVSMAKREEIEYVLERAGLIDQFAVIISSEDVANCKPDPECFLKGFNALDSWRVKQQHLPMVHSECLVIEDSPPGIAAGRAARLKTLGVTNTVSAAELREAGADAVTANLNDWMPESARRVFV